MKKICPICRSENVKNLGDKHNEYAEDDGYLYVAFKIEDDCDSNFHQSIDRYVCENEHYFYIGK